MTPPRRRECGISPVGAGDDGNTTVKDDSQVISVILSESCHPERCVGSDHSDADR
ncbi:MAG: hypothetical protein IJK73_01545 [Bacteroidales bacterium]|nr:hypothetical protein [Bacteroidales bacterium]